LNGFAIKQKFNKKNESVPTILDICKKNIDLNLKDKLFYSTTFC